MPDDDNLIVLDTEDLPEVDTPEKIIIELDDLDDDEIFPGMPSDSAGFSPTVKAGGNPIIRSNILQNIIAGAIGGLLAWLVTEMLFEDNGTAQSLEQIIIEMALFGGVIGGLMGSALGAAGVITGVAPVALRGEPLVALGGMVGGGIGQILYNYGGGTFATNSVCGCWPMPCLELVGLFIGLGQGISFRSARK